MALPRPRTLPLPGSLGSLPAGVPQPSTWFNSSRRAPGTPDGPPNVHVRSAHGLGALEVPEAGVRAAARAEAAEVHGEEVVRVRLGLGHVRLLPAQTRLRVVHLARWARGKSAFKNARVFAMIISM